MNKGHLSIKDTIYSPATNSKQPLKTLSNVPVMFALEGFHRIAILARGCIDSIVEDNNWI